MQIQDKIIVVTGAASGIGKALAGRFKREGARCFLRLAHESERTRPEIEAELGFVLHCARAGNSVDSARRSRGHERPGRRNGRS